MGLQQLELPGMNKMRELEATAIARLQYHEPLTNGLGFYFADSYGKDSTVVNALLDKAGVKHDAHFNFTTVDPPEVIEYGKKYHPETIIEYPAKSMYQLILERGVPRRNARFCCQELKEHGGEGRFVVTGVRWAESVARSSLGMIELCNRGLGKKFLHPIIDWTSEDVWNYIHLNNIPYCKLYDEGFKRLGCILCPMSSAKQATIEIERFPKIARAYRLTIEKLWNKNHGRLKSYDQWESPEALMQWWLSRKGQGKNEAQRSMFV